MTKKSKKLSLNRETMIHLAADALERVAGGKSAAYGCVSANITYCACPSVGWCPSEIDSCPKKPA